MKLHIRLDMLECNAIMQIIISTFGSFTHFAFNSDHMPSLKIYWLGILTLRFKGLADFIGMNGDLISILCFDT